jgi:GAF domain-containing protein
MPAPRQPVDATRRRLRAIRRLGLDDIETVHRETLDRFTRLAASVFKTSMAVVTIVANDTQLFPSEVGLNMRKLELDVGLCCHTVMAPGSGDQCMIVPDASDDWRFRRNPLVDSGRGPIQFYAGAPLRVGKGAKTAVIGTLCIIDNKPRTFGAHGRAVLLDLAECVVSEVDDIGFCGSKTDVLVGTALYSDGK